LKPGKDFQITSSSDGGGICNISLTGKVPPCAASGGGGGGGGGKRSGYTINNITNNWSTRIDCNQCHNYLCQEGDTNCGTINCKQSNCPNAATMCGSVSSEECPTVSPTPLPSGGGGSTDSYPKNPQVAYNPIYIYHEIMNIGSNPDIITNLKNIISKQNKSSWLEKLSKDQKTKLGLSSDNTTDCINWLNSLTSTLKDSDSCVLMQYPINVKLDRSKGQGGYNKDVVWNTQNPVNPVYSWEGLATALYIWNTFAKAMGISGVCCENDHTKRMLTLAIFLGNATVESANFMVCQESILGIGKNSNCKDCSVYSKGGNTFPTRYFNNCDDANPYTYSCQDPNSEGPCGAGGGGGGGGGGACMPKDKNIVKCTGCYTNTSGYCKGTNGVCYPTQKVNGECICPPPSTFCTKLPEGFYGGGRCW
jgi:hypothetical protein